jgi:DNA-binding transcriptional MerR regulator/effector-binding domain-containing protein
MSDADADADTRQGAYGGMFTIGEFSRATGITVKALRFYHDERLLVPSFVDPQSGYRYYAPALLERARVITYLRSLEFPLDEVRAILQGETADRTDDEPDEEDRILGAMERHKASIEQRVRKLRGVVRSLDQFITHERQAKVMTQPNYDGVQEKPLDPMLIAGIRMKGRYSDCSKGFAKIGRYFGRLSAGPCFLLHYDTEYKENDAEFETCMPVKQPKNVDGVSVRQLPGGRCVSLLHKGPYDQLGPSYAKVIGYVKSKGYTIVSPTREVYLKGPGMIFKGNPRNYLTEIQIPIEDSSAA